MNPPSLSWQETYYMFATFAACAGILSCVISILLFVRTRPDRLKSRIDESLAPFGARITAVERQQLAAEHTARETAQKHETGIRALDHDISGRIKQFSDTQEAMRRDQQQRHEVNTATLARISAQLEHGIKRDELNSLHHRVTEVAKGQAQIKGAMEGLVTTVQNIEDFLRTGT